MCVLLYTLCIIKMQYIIIIIISILKEISPEHSSEGLLLKLKPILWPPGAKNWLIRKDPDAGKDWRQEEKGTTEDEMVGWHQRLDGHEFEQTPGDVGQESLTCCSPWGAVHWVHGTRVSYWTELIYIIVFIGQNLVKRPNVAARKFGYYSVYSG